MMHIIKNFAEKILVDLLGGTRVPKWSTKKNPDPDEHAPDYEDRVTSQEAQVERWKQACVKARRCGYTLEERKEVDYRLRTLVGPPNWIKQTMVSSFSPCR
jgi:hypothetical protein